MPRTYNMRSMRTEEVFPMPFEIDYCPSIEVGWGGFYCLRLAKAQQRLVMYPPILRIRR